MLRILDNHELSSINGGGIWQDLGYAVGSLAGMLYSSVRDFPDAIKWARQQTQAMHPGGVVPRY